MPAEIPHDEAMIEALPGYVAVFNKKDNPTCYCFPHVFDNYPDLKKNLLAMFKESFKGNVYVMDENITELEKKDVHFGHMDVKVIHHGAQMYYVSIHKIQYWRSP